MWMHGKHSVQTMLVFMGKGHMSSHGADNTRVAGRRLHPNVHWFILAHSPAIRAASVSLAYIRSTASPNQ